MAETGEQIGTARIDIIADTKQFDAEIARAKSQVATLGPEGEKSFQKMTAAQKRATVAALKFEQGVGKSREEVKLLSLAARGAAPEALDRLRGAYQKAALDAARFSDAQIFSANKALAAYKAQAAEQAAASTFAAESQAQQTARLSQVAAAALAEVDARKAAAAEQMAEAKAREANTAATAKQATASRARVEIAALESATVKAQMADFGMLQRILDGNIKKETELAAAEAALDRLQQRSAISNVELAAAFEALNKVTEKNTVVNVANAASRKGLNSRTQYEIGVLAGEIASGNTSRVKRSIPALLNASGLTKTLLSPVGLGLIGVTAALATFGIAVVGREKDLLAFNKALASTGDFAGTTGAQLQGTAAIVGTSTGRYADATAAVLALAKSGDVLGSRMQEMATTAVNMAYLTGESVDKVVKDLIALQGDPTQAVVKLTGAMGLLTAAQFNQIVETQQQQGAAAAAALTMKDLGAASDTARKTLVDNAGFVIRAWEAVKNDFSDIGRAIASIGAQSTTISKIADINAQIKTLNASIAATSVQGEKNAYQQRIQELQQQLVPLRQQQRTDAMFAAGQELANQAKKAHDKALAAALASDKQGEAGLLSQLKDINHQRLLALYGVVDPATRDKVSAFYDQQVRDAVKRANSQLPRGASMGSGGGGRAFDADKYRQKALDDIQKEIQAEGKLADARARSEAAVKAYQNSLNDMLQTRQAQIDLQVQSVGMGQLEVQQRQALIAIDQDYNRKADSLRRQQQNTTSEISKAAYGKQLDDLKKYHDQRIQIEVQGFAAERAAQADAMNGVDAAISDFLDQQRNLAEQSRQFTQNFIQGFGDAFASFASGAESAKDAFGSLIDSMYQQALKFLANQAMTKFFEMIGGTGPSGLNAGYFGSFDEGAAENTATGVIGSILGDDSSGGSSGGWFSSLLSGLFGGGRASGGAVDAGRLYRVNEDGPELLSVGDRSYLMMGNQGGSVTPNADVGRSGSRAVTVNQTVVVNGLSNRRTREQLAQETARRQRVAIARS